MSLVVSTFYKLFSEGVLTETDKRVFGELMETYRDSQRTQKHYNKVLASIKKLNVNLQGLYNESVMGDNNEEDKINQTREKLIQKVTLGNRLYQELNNQQNKLQDQWTNFCQTIPLKDSYRPVFRLLKNKFSISDVNAFYNWGLPQLLKDLKVNDNTSFTILCFTQQSTIFIIENALKDYLNKEKSIRFSQIINDDKKQIHKKHVENDRIHKKNVGLIRLDNFHLFPANDNQITSAPALKRMKRRF